MKNTDQNIKTGLIIGGVFLGWQYFLKPLLEGLNLKETQSDKDQADSIKQGGGDNKTPITNPWDKAYLKYLQDTQKPGQTIVLLTQSSANNLVKQIYDSSGFFNDNEAQLYGAFRQLTYKTQLSQLSDNFYKTYKRDLYSFIKGFLNTEELATVTSMVINLKSGYK